MDLDFIKCALCLNKCSPATTSCIKGININNPTPQLQRDITSQAKKLMNDFPMYKADKNPLKDQLRMIFLLRKILEIPQKHCCDFLEVYGDPSSWIDCCDSCSVLVENAKTIFDQIIMLQNKFAMLQSEIKNTIIQTVKFEENVCLETEWGVKETIRSFFNQGISDVKTAIPKLETVGDFCTSDLKSAELTVFSEENVNSSLVQNERVEENDFSLHKQTILLNEDDKCEYEDHDPILGESDISHLANNILKEDKNEKTSSTNLEGNSKLSYFPATSFNSDDVGLQSIEKDDFPYQLNDFTCEAYECDSIEQDPLKLDEAADDIGDNIIIKEETLDHRAQLLSNEFNSYSETSDNNIKFYSFHNDECCEDVVEKSKSTNLIRIPNRRKSHKCSFCKKCCRTLSDLKVHERVHTGEKPFKCNVCEKVFKDSSTLKRHEKIHTGKRYKCNACGKGFKDSSNLKRHEKIHTGKHYKCNVCEKGFAQKSNLSTHERIHTGEKPYKCKFCGREFAQRYSLTIHERSHTGERPFECKVCKNRFVESSALRRHERIHTGKHYKCNVCGTAFAQKGNLTTHERIHTGQKAYYR